MAKRYGLLLNLGGAPNAPHTIPGWPGLFRPDVPTPVGGAGDRLTLEEAKERLAEWEAGVDKAEAEWNDFERECVEDPSHVRNEPQPFERPEPPLILVEIKDVKAAEAVRDQDLAATKGAIAEARKSTRSKRRPPAGDVEQIEDAAEAVAGEESQ